MRRAILLSVGVLLILAPRTSTAVQTGEVELGVNGAYDGTVWITRNSSGSLVFNDQRIGTSVTLEDLLTGQKDHGALSGLADDDHQPYLTTTRHWQGHTAILNAELTIPPDVGNNSTLGGHTADGDIHVVKSGVETITGAWRFTGTPVFAPSLLVEPVAPGPDGYIAFGTEYDAPRISYLGGSDVFQFSRPIAATTGSLMDLVSVQIRVAALLDGTGEGGQPTAALANFASVCGITASDLLDRSANEDVTGQWDFLAPVRMFDDLTIGDAAASGVISTVGLLFTTQTEAAEQSAAFSRIETTSDSLRIVVDRDGNYPQRTLFAGADLAVGGEYTTDSKEMRFVVDADNDNGATDAYAFAFNGTNDRFAMQLVNGATWQMIGRTAGNVNWFIVSGNSNGAILQSHEANRHIQVRRGSSPGVWLSLNDAAGADRVRIRDSGGVDRWTCDSDGNVAMVADAKLTMPDGNDGAFVRTFNVAANYYPDALETLAPTTRSLTGLEYQGSGVSYVGFPVSNDLVGADVVLDRITIYCSQIGGSGTSISALALVDDTTSAVRTYSSPVSQDTQWLSSDFTMDDTRSYVIRLTFSSSAGGSMRVTRFKVEYHLE